MKKLSIITICYNEPDLEKTCRSIVNQTWQDFEWIVIDGGSNEETLAIFDKYKYRIDKFVSEPDNGIYNACNKGIKLAESEYVQLLNAGDSYYDTKVLEDVFKEQNYCAGVLYGDQCEVYQNSNKKCVKKLQPFINKWFFVQFNIHTPAVFVKRDLYLKYGLFNENYKIVSDFEKWIVFLKNGVNFQYLNRIIANFDKNGISSDKKTEALHNKEREEILKQFYTPEEIRSGRQGFERLNFWENIFSIKKSLRESHLIITIMGIHLKLKRSMNV